MLRLELKIFIHFILDISKDQPNIYIYIYIYIYYVKLKYCKLEQ